MMLRIGLAGLVVLAAAPAWATTSISGTVNEGVESILGAMDDSQTNTSSAMAPTSVTINTAANAAVSDGAATNSTFAAISASWTSADAGAFDLNWGWNIDAPGYASQTVAMTNLSYPVNWAYTFIASGNGTFSGTYNVTASGDKFGLQPLYTTNDWTSGSLGGDVFDPTGSGVFSVALLSGHTYTMSLADYGNISDGTGFSANASADASVQWQIAYNAVPEPAGWALMIVGFGLSGAAMRRRKALA